MFHLFSLFFPQSKWKFQHCRTPTSGAFCSGVQRMGKSIFEIFFWPLEYERRFWVWASVFGVMKLADSFSYWSRITCLFFFFPSPHVRYILHQPCRPINPSIWIVMGYLIGKLGTTTLNFNKDKFVQSFSLF